MRRGAAGLIRHMTQIMTSKPLVVESVAQMPSRLCTVVAAQKNVQMKSFVSSSTSFASSSLAGVLRNEIEYEKQNYSQPEELAGGPPPPFTLTETLGDTLMSLTRQYSTDETITVDVMVNEQPEEEPYENEDGVLDVDVGVVFTVQVARGNESLVFECKGDGSYISILHVSVEPTDGQDIEDSAYTGPVFEELDDELQNQFQSYLEERGIGPDFAGYLLRLVHDKEEREYVHWLERCHKFISRSL